MAYTITTTNGVTGFGKAAPSIGNTYTVDAIEEFDDPIPATTTNEEIDINIPVTGLKYIYIVPKVNMTLKTNSTGSPDQTLSLIANRGIVWGANDLGTCPITTAITKIYVSNATAAAAVLDIRAGYDSTP